MSQLMKDIEEYISSNRKHYDELEKRISDNIDGRCCHYKVEVINALIEVSEDIKTYLEIGVHNGTSMSYAVSTSKSIDCCGIDLFEDSKQPGLNAQFYWRKDGIQIERTHKNISSNNTSKSTVHLIQGDSTAEETYEQVKDKDIDLLFIDGNHTYGYVKKDFERYSTLVKPGGFIILDDYEPKWPGVVKFAKEIDSKKYETIGVYRNNELILRRVK